MRTDRTSAREKYRAIVRGTRILPDAIVNSCEAGKLSTSLTRIIRGFPFRKSGALSNSPVLTVDSPSREGAARREPPHRRALANATPGCLQEVQRGNFNRKQEPEE